MEQEKERKMTRVSDPRRQQQQPRENKIAHAEMRKKKEREDTKYFEVREALGGGGQQVER